VSLTLQVLVTGLAAGGVYGLVAVGHSVIYRLTGIVHLAFGDLIGLGVFATLLVASGTGPVSQTSVPAGRFLVAVVIGVGVCVVVGVLGYAFAVMPYLARHSTIGWAAATLALAFAVRNLVAAIFTRPGYVFPDPIPFRDLGNAGLVTVGGTTFQARAPFVLAFAAALAALASWALRASRPGRALRAISDDRTGAAVVGLPVDRLVAAAFGLAGGLAALAAIAAAPSGPFDVDSGALLGLKGLIAALLVRFGSPGRAFAAGLAIGVLEAAIANADLGGITPGPAWAAIAPLILALGLILGRSLREPVWEWR
jgi:branched-chain amino acid transport system permease protein